MGAFSETVKQFAGKFDAANKDTMSAVAFKTYEKIIKGSPVDTGRFRANWFITGYQPSAKVTKQTGDPTNDLLTLRTKIDVHRDKGTWHFTNNLPYSEVIEFGGYPAPVKPETVKRNKKKYGFAHRTAGGYSLQAPYGVVRIAFRDIERNLAEEAKKNRV